MSDVNLLEVRFERALKRAGIPYEAQKAVGNGGDYCRSKYPCRCGEQWYDEDGGRADGNVYGGDGDDCEWYVAPYTKYFIDFFIPIGTGLAIELDGSYHDDPNQRRRDRERQHWIEVNYGYRFVRLPSRLVLTAQMHLLVDWCLQLPEMAAEQVALPL